MRPKVTGKGTPMIHSPNPPPTPMKSATNAIPPIQPLSLAWRSPRNFSASPRFSWGASRKTPETRGPGLMLMYRARKRAATTIAGERRNARRQRW